MLRKRRLTYRLVALGLGAALALTAATIQLVLRRGGPMMVLTDASLFIASAALLSSGLGVSASIIEILWGILASQLGVRFQPPLDVLGGIGSVFLLFILGLEMRVEVTLHLARRYFIPSVITYASSVLGITYLLNAVGSNLTEALCASLILASGNAVMAYSLIKSVGYDRTGMGDSTVMPALLMQFASIIAFAVIVGGVSSTLIVYAIMAVVSLLILPKLARYVITSLPTRRETEAEVRIVIACLLVLSLLSKELGVSASIIAFILGLALSESVRTAKAVEDKIRGLTNGFLAPIFFFVVGLRFAFPRELIAAWVVPALILILWLGKVEGLRALLKIMGRSVPSRRIASATLANVSVAALIAEMGLSTGLLSMSTYALVITASLITSVVSAALLRARPEE